MHFSTIVAATLASAVAVAAAPVAFVPKGEPHLAELPGLTDSDLKNRDVLSISELLGRKLPAESDYDSAKMNINFNRLDNGLKAREAESAAYSEHYGQKGIHGTGS